MRRVLPPLRVRGPAVVAQCSRALAASELAHITRGAPVVRGALGPCWHQGWPRAGPDSNPGLLVRTSPHALRRFLSVQTVFCSVA